MTDGQMRNGAMMSEELTNEKWRNDKWDYDKWNHDFRTNEIYEHITWLVVFPYNLKLQIKVCVFFWNRHMLHVGQPAGAG